MLKRLIRHIFFCCVVSLLSQHPAQAAFENAEEFFLDNGMQVVVIPNHKAPIVFHAVLYKEGSVDEHIGKGGLAHLTEHLMFRGTHKFPDGRFNQLIENNGGQSNAGTSHDFTYYHQFLNIRSLELAMYMEADRMNGLALEDNAFYQERKIVFQERQQRMNSNVASAFWEKFNKFFHGDSPYGNPVAGTEKEIAALTKKDVDDFYRRYYTPSNAVLILSGDIDVQTAQDLAQKYYGSIKNKKDKHSRKSVIEDLENKQKEASVLSEFHKEVSVNRAVAQYMLPHYAGNDKKLYALMLYADWVGDGVNSLVYKELVEKQKIAVSAGTEFSFLTRGNSLFSFYAYFNKTADFPKLQKQFYSVLQQSEKQLTAKVLADLKEKELAGLIYQNDNPSHAADIVLSWLGADYTLEDIKNFEKNINQVTLDDIKTVIKDIKEIYPVWGVVSPLGDEK